MAAPQFVPHEHKPWVCYQDGIHAFWQLKEGGDLRSVTWMPGSNGVAMQWVESYIDYTAVDQMTELRKLWQTLQFVRKYWVARQLFNLSMGQGMADLEYSRFFTDSEFKGSGKGMGGKGECGKPGTGKGYTAGSKGKSSQKCSFQQEALNKGQRMLTIHAKEKK